MNTDLILGINPCISGLNFHDPSVCLIYNRKIIFAVEEERLNRIKHSNGLFPYKSVEICRLYAEKIGCKITDIAIGYNPALWNRRIQTEIIRCVHNSGMNDLINGTSNFSPEMSIQIIQRMIYELSDLVVRKSCFDKPSHIAMRLKIESDCSTANVTFYEHHLAHAASAYYASGYERALCLVVDGTGEYATTSFWIADREQIKKLQELTMPNSLGYFYAIATAFAGFQAWNEEGKLMALSPYGHPNEAIRDKINTIIHATDNGYDVGEFISKCLCDGLAIDIPQSINTLSKIMGAPPRKAKDEITDWYKDFAFEIQRITELITANMLNYWIRETGITYVCAAGGLFLNCKMNMYLRENTLVDGLFVQPVAGDAGTSIGAAMLLDIQKNGYANYELYGLGLGPAFSDKDIETVLRDAHILYHRSENLPKSIAELLVQDKIVCLFSGPCELGPRALGHRSILASPCKQEMSDAINRRIKHREVWRPFACSILAEQAAEILDCYDEKKQQPDYMIEAYRINRQWETRIPAVIHKADFTTRPQIVHRKDNQPYYDIINEFYRITDVPVILNTSLNDRGQPIINTPRQALEFFIFNDVDAMALNDYLLLKEDTNV